MTDQGMSAGASLRYLRKLAGLTLEETASIADTSVAYLSKVETGRLIPTRGYVAQIAGALADRMKAAA